VRFGKSHLPHAMLLGLDDEGNVAVPIQRTKAIDLARKSGRERDQQNAPVILE
jgi:hypothetical protein